MALFGKPTFGDPRETGLLKECTYCGKRRPQYTRTGLCEGCYRDQEKIKNTIILERAVLPTINGNPSEVKRVRDAIESLERDLAKFPTKEFRT